MSGQYVRYLRHVRVCYLLLGWWYLALTARKSKWFMGNQERKKYMTKNTTRKGLALGAAIALVAAGFAGATPAYAAFATLDASFGTKGATQNGLLGQTFNMASTSDTVASAKFYVTGASASELVVTARSVTDLEAATGYSAATITNQTVGLAKAATVQPASWTAANFSQMLWSLSGVTATTTITITPFLDTVVADGKITAGEVSGTPVTLTFHKASEVTATTTIDSLTVGATAVDASVVLDKGINMASIGGGVSVYFAQNGAAFGAIQTAAYDAVENAFLASSASAPTANNVYTAQARLSGTAAANNSGAAAISNVATGTVATLSDLTPAKGTSYLATDGTSADLVRAGAGTVSVSTTAKTSTGAAAAGAPVTFVIEETAANSVDVAATITAGGKTLAGTATTAQKISVVVNTDATGKASLDIAYAGIKEGNTFKVTSSAVSATGAATAASGDLTETFTGQDSAATAIVDVNQLGGANGDNPVHTTTVGGSVGIAYKVVDQFGQTPAGTLRLKVATAATGGQINSTLAVSAGNANLSITDNSDAAGSYNAVATVEKYNAVADAWNAVSGVTVTSVVNVAAALPAASRVTVTETPDSTATSATNVLSSAALATVDARLSQDSVALPAIPAANSTLSGVVYGANGAPQAGASVTLYAAGVMFVTNAGTAADGHYSLGSTTIKTDANGAWGDVDLLSITAGKHTVTVSSGSANTTTDVFFGAAAHNAGSKVTITAPTSVRSGSTLQVSAVVTDKFGNPVNTSGSGDAATVAVSYTGPGLIVGTLPTETDANGKVNFNVLMGSNDTGNFVATVTYLNAGASTAAADKIAASATVVVGAAGVTTEPVATWTKNQNDGTIKVYAKNIVGQGKVQFMVNGEEIAWVRAATSADSKLREANGSYYLVRTVELVEGQKNVVEIYVDGERTTRTAYTY